MRDEFIASLKDGDFVWVSNNTILPDGCAKVVQRTGFRGRVGYTVIKLEAVRNSVKSEYQISSNELIHKGTLREATSEEIESYCKENNIDNPTTLEQSLSFIRRESKSRIFALEKQLANALAEVQSLKSSLKIAETRAELAESHIRYGRVSSASSSFKLSSDVSKFIQVSKLDKFPCSPEELKSARTKMISELHPDHTKRDSNAEFCSAMRGYNELTKHVP